MSVTLDDLQHTLHTVTHNSRRHTIGACGKRVVAELFRGGVHSIEIVMTVNFPVTATGFTFTFSGNNANLNQKGFSV